jgi:DNA-binding NtrC family response regulator
MGINILIVEDEFVVANDLRLLLGQAGYIVSGIASTAEKAAELLLKRRPDLVLLDIILKGKQSGIDLARKLRAENIAFVYLSANSNQEILEEAKTTEPYGFLVKPFREKDLLVTLDIALYRHKHSLESKSHQEAFLKKQLMEIVHESSDARKKLLKVARSIQPYIPFDLIASGFRPPDKLQVSDKGYLRIGFDEYQFIGEDELATITGLSKSVISRIVDSYHIESDAHIYSKELTKKTTSGSSLQKILMDCFRMESYLAFPVDLGKGLFAYYFFYSRKQGIYTNEHLALLTRLQTCFTELERSSALSKGNVVPVNMQHAEVVNRPAYESIIGSHPLLLSAFDLVAQVAPYNTSVLLLGESGTGKEKVAQSIHTLSPRSNGPFIKVNCAAIPASLMESELFGHEKGAFTGAIDKRKGRFEMADGGTIFLDEIGELPLEMQVKLLRALQEKEIERVGSSSLIKVNVRIVAATNRNLEKEVRLDLYYRLNVFPITLPPLRERKTDLESLTIYFANRFCSAVNKPFHGIDELMMEEMLAYDWPGNVRELENIVEQSVILNDGKSKLQLRRRLTITSEPSSTTGINTFEEVKQIQRETEKEYIISILKRTKGRIRGTNGAAKLLNIKPTTLESKMVKLNIKREEFINAMEDK